MSNTITSTNEAEILARVIERDEQGLSPEAAQSVLQWRFPEEDIERINLLSQKANAGTLTPAEQELLDCYERVGHLIAIAHSKAREKS